MKILYGLSCLAFCIGFMVITCLFYMFLRGFSEFNVNYVYCVIIIVMLPSLLVACIAEHMMEDDDE